MGKVTIKWFVDFGDKHGAMIMTMTVVSMTMMRTNKGMKDANYKCRAQGGNASCIQSLALPLMQKELGCSLSEDAEDQDDHFKDGDQD